MTGARHGVDGAGRAGGMRAGGVRGGVLPGPSGWHAVCRVTELLPERGAAALVAGVQVAVFRTFDGGLHAVGNLDPFSGAQVISRGILGCRDGAPVVASPMFKQVFDLRTGECLSEPGPALPVFGARVRDGRVEVSLTAAAWSGAGAAADAGVVLGGR
ncbi:nitrite reductase small subunit NirD [Actinomadura oligospora]|uniref:nitrite reductase small subunit NirD n=1 Tax=Actinomadura oligospora TaxID=111804 RepID=UPI0004B12C72|nr:nitrite reductase small subunit NirD [Actinomadura oligospora]